VKVTRLSEPRCEQTFEECIKIYGGINPLQEGIPRDGQYSRLPYFLFQDPSFYGSLWINPQRIGISFLWSTNGKAYARGNNRCMRAERFNMVLL
jgi:hypothetical protein